MILILKLFIQSTTLTHRHKMSGYGYTIIISENVSPNRNKGKVQKKNKELIAEDTSVINDINDILRKQFTNQCYDSHLDHLMLFSTEFLNTTTFTHYKCIYVISLAPIKHDLFLNDIELNLLLGNHKDKDNKRDVYTYYPSFRFNKFHTDDFFSINKESNQVVINKQQTNSHGLARMC